MPIYPNEICPFCQENLNISYICENCHEMFCGDCVVIKTESQMVCWQCGEKDAVVDRHGNVHCKSCGNTELRTINELIPTCPNCESTSVVKIEEKQEDLLNEYKTIISDSRTFIHPLEQMANRINNFRNDLFQLRQDYPQCFHYPTLESEAQVVFKMFDGAKATLYDHVTRFFQEIQRNIHYINEIKITHPSNLAYISEILQYFSREQEKVMDTGATVLAPLEKKMLPLESKIDFMQNVQTKFNPFLGKMNLEPEERIVFAIKCKLSTGTAKSGSGSSGQDGDGLSGSGLNNKNGTILITSKRLYFYHQQGVFKKRTVELFSVQLSDLQYAGVKGKLTKKVSLEFLNSMYKFSISKDNREKLVEWIEKAQNFGTAILQNDNNFKSFTKYKIHSKVFREELENAIYELIGFHGSKISSNYSNSSAEIVNSHMNRTSRLSRAYIQETNKGPNLPSNLQTKVSSPRMNEGRSPNARNFTQYATPAGHFGYPHDFQNPASNLHTASPVPNGNSLSGSANSNIGFSNNPYNVSMPSSSSMETNPFSTTPVPNPYKAPVPMRSPPLGNQGIQSFPSASSGFSNRSNEEMALRNEINYLNQEKYVLYQTLQMLESRFDSGTINEADFIKAYQEIQRKTYVYTNRIDQLQGYLANSSTAVINN
jgi:hypothetical protein